MPHEANNQSKRLVPVRPDEEQIIYGELNLERWPNLWNTGEGTSERHLHKDLSFPDGRRLSTKITVIPSPAVGDLTTESCKVFSVLLAMRQDLLGPKALGNMDAERIPLGLRKLSTRLHPDTTRTNAWGKKRHAAVLRHLRKLSEVSIHFKGSFWNAREKRPQRFRGGFSLISDYYVLEERRYTEAEPKQLPLELGYFRLNPFVIDNLTTGFHAPFYLSERLGLSGFALVLYNQLDLKMTSREKYERDVAELFEEDFPEMGEKYPAPSQRARALRRALTQLEGRRLTTGPLIDTRIVSKTNHKGKKLVARKRAFPLKLAGVGESSEIQPSEEQALQNLLVEDILKVTNHAESTAFYHLVVRNLDQFIIRRFLAEIRADEAGDFEGSIGKLFFVKVRDYCRDQRIEPFWKTA